MNSTSSFITQKPNSTFLQKYIAYYYFHQSTNSTHQENFIFYPHIKNALTVYFKAAVFFDKKKQQGIIRPSTNNIYTSIYTPIQTKPWNINIYGPFQKLGIVFTPLGLNNFTKNSLQSIFNNNDISINTKVTDQTIFNLLKVVFSNQPLSIKVQNLDTFFEQRYTPFRNQDIQNAIQLIIASKEKKTVQSIAQELQINRRTLLRQFKKHLLCSVKDYIDVVQFRKALEQYQFTSNKPSFTDLAYSNDYYDQSELIRHFQQKTGLSPKIFFKELAHLGSEDTLWTFK